MITPSKRLELFFWSAVPGLITVLLLIVCLTPKHMSGFGNFMPLLPLLPVFYWGMLPAGEMHYWLVFTVGLVTDAITGLPLGLSALSYVFFLALLRAQRKYFHKEGFIIKWAYFAVLLLVIACIDWLLMSLINGAPQNLMPPFLQWLITAACYPLFHRCFDMLCEHISARRWQILHGH